VENHKFRVRIRSTDTNGILHDDVKLLTDYRSVNNIATAWLGLGFSLVCADVCPAIYRPTGFVSSLRRVYSLKYSLYRELTVLNHKLINLGTMVSYFRFSVVNSEKIWYHLVP
jgi:hypothetical protein